MKKLWEGKGWKLSVEQAGPKDRRGEPKRAKVVKKEKFDAARSEERKFRRSLAAEDEPGLRRSLKDGAASAFREVGRGRWIRRVRGGV